MVSIVSFCVNQTQDPLATLQLDGGWEDVRTLDVACVPGDGTGVGWPQEGD